MFPMQRAVEEAPDRSGPRNPREARVPRCASHRLYFVLVHQCRPLWCTAACEHPGTLLFHDLWFMSSSSFL